MPPLQTEQPDGQILDIQYFQYDMEYSYGTWYPPYWQNPGPGPMQYYIIGGGQGGQGGSTGPYNTLRPGGQGGQGGQFVSGTAHSKDFGATEPIHVGQQLNDAYEHYVNDNWAPWHPAKDAAPFSATPAGVAPIPAPAPSSSFAGITALGGGQGFTSKPTDAGSGGAGAALGSDNASQSGMPGVLPAQLVAMGAPVAPGGQASESTYQHPITGLGLRDGWGGVDYPNDYQGKGLLPPPWIGSNRDRRDLQRPSWTPKVVPGTIYGPGAGGSGTASWQGAASNNSLGDNAGMGGYPGGGGGGGGASQRGYWKGHGPVWNVPPDYPELFPWYAFAVEWDGIDSALTAGGDGSWGLVVVVTLFRRPSDKPLYLRMDQRNDGLGVARHPRLQVPGANEASSKQSKSIRLGETNTYR